jgi:ATP-binding cassette subfamily C protein CydC
MSLVRLLRMLTVSQDRRGANTSGFAAAGWKLAVVSVAAGAATVLASVGLVTTSGYLLARAAERPPILDLMLVIVTVRFFGLARPVLRYGERLASHDVTFRMLRQIRRWFYDALVPLAPARLMAFRSGDLLARLAGDVDSLQELHLRLIAPALVACLVSAVVVGALLIFVDPALAFIVLGLLLLNAAVWPWLARRVSRGAGARRSRERAAMSQRLVSFLQGLEDLQAFGRDGDELTRLMGHQRVLNATDARDGLAGALHAAASSAFAQLGVWTALAIAVPMALTGSLPGTWVAAVALGVLAAFEAVDALPTAWQRHEQLEEAAGRVFEVIDAEPAVVDATARVAHPFAIACGREPARRADVPLLRVSGVTFAYGGVPALRDVAFDVAAGEHIALVGPSGSGKSTLLSLLVRAWDPAAGHIELAGRHLPDIALADVRASIAFMPQQVYVFDDSLRESVRLARPSASDDEVHDALRGARLGAFLAAAPRGLATRLGEHGCRMSAGERQRLGLARLFLSDAPLVLLDEPTANLDPDNAREVIASLRTWAGSRTLLLATHRLDDLETMDRVLVFDRGRLVEHGTHADLLSRGGLYARLLDSQYDLLQV